MTATEEIVVAAHSVLSITGTFFNVLLIYLVIFHSPAILKRYSILIFNTAFFDLIACLMEFFMQERMIPAGDGVVFDSHGPCKYFGPHICFISHGIACHAWVHNMHSCLFSFCYRLYVLHYNPPSYKAIVIGLILQYIPSLSAAIAIALSYDDPVAVMELVTKHVPDYDLQNHTISGVLNINTNRFYQAKMMLVDFPEIPMFLLILVVRQIIVRTLNKQRKSMAKRTESMHADLLKALTCQGFLPLFYCFGVISYMSGQTLEIHHPLLENATILWVEVAPTVSPLVTLYFVRPYRAWIVRRFKEEKPPVEGQERGTMSNTNVSGVVSTTPQPKTTAVRMYQPTTHRSTWPGGPYAAAQVVPTITKM